MNNERMTPAERRLTDILVPYQRQTLVNCKGVEQIFVTELVRSLDEAAFAFALAPNRQQLLREDGARHAMLTGAALALRPLLSEVRSLPGPIPWVGTNRDLARCADDYLINCGNLAAMLRVAALERYGLCTSSFPRHDHLVLEVASSDGERHDVESLEYLRGLIQEGRTPLENGLLSLAPAIRQRLDEYVRVDNDEFIAYDNDASLVAYYRSLAHVRATDYFESEALPSTAPIGGSTFSRWCDRAVAASGRVLQHVAFATLLRSQRRSLDLRNLLTIYVRKDDLTAVLEESGDTADQAGRFIAATTLDDAAAQDYASDHEIPVPLYVALSEDFVLLPCFGALLNPIAGLVRSLRLRYRSDWDRAVEGREAVFRSDLADIFARPRFLVLDRGVRLRRTDGSELTDLDAVVIDRDTGALGLFQLKWHDIFGRSVRERESRRLNLLKANDWVRRVSEWIDGKSSAAVAAQLGLDLGAGDECQRPHLFVISRYAAQFTGNHRYDPRAAWLGWPDLVRTVPSDCQGNVIDLLAGAFKGGLTTTVSGRQPGGKQTQFPGLTVEVRWQ
jgi:hypothetical protein